jgi:hypothetical protein
LRDRTEREAAKVEITGVRYEIAIDGTPRTYRDRRELAIEAATSLKTKGGVWKWHGWRAVHHALRR